MLYAYLCIVYLVLENSKVGRWIAPGMIVANLFGSGLHIRHETAAQNVSRVYLFRRKHDLLWLNEQIIYGLKIWRKKMYWSGYEM